jgi:WD40 repeat protein
VLPNGDIASGSLDTTIKVWSVDGALRKSLYGHTYGIRGLAVHSSGDLISASNDDIKIWSNKGTVKLYGHTSDVNGLAIRQNGDIVSGSSDRTVKIWHENGQLKNTLSYHCSGVQSVAALPSGDVASGSFDGRIIISDSDGQVKCSFEAHEKNSEIWGLVALPNGQLASSSGDKKIKIWTCE